MLWNFLKSFFGTPKLYYNDYSLEYIIRAEATHFLLSSAAAGAVYLSISTILRRRRSQWGDRYIFRFSLLCALVASLTIHILVDAFSELA